MRFFFGSIALAGLIVTSCGTNGPGYVAENRKIDASLAQDQIDTLIEPYRAEMDRRMSDVIGYSDSSLLSFAPESPLGNFVADVVFQYGAAFAGENGITSETGNIFALLNFGGLRRPINQGEITVGEIYELMPFDNSIVIVSLKRERMQELMDYLITMHGQPVSNAEFSLSETEQHVKIGQKSFSEEAGNFYVITSDYLANGGDKMNFFKDPIASWNTGLLIRDVLLEFIRKKGNLPYQPVENRMKFGS